MHTITSPTSRFVNPDEEMIRWHKLSPGLRTKGRVRGGGEPLRPRTIECYWEQYIRLLRLLHRLDLYDPDAPPAERWTSKILDAVLRLEKTPGEPYAPKTQILRLTSLFKVLSVLAPSSDHQWIRDRSKVFLPTVVRAKVIAHPNELWSWGQQNMTWAMTKMPVGFEAGQLRDEALPVALRGAYQYQTGLQICWLAKLALRLANMVMMEKDRTLRFQVDKWWLTFARHQMKGRRRFDRMVPPELIASLQNFDKYIRPILCQGKYRSRTYKRRDPGAFLWISSRGEAQSGQSIRSAVKKMTKVKFGKAITPHWFRDAVATAIAHADPAQMSRASWSLGNDLATMNFTYNHAGKAPARKMAVARLNQLCAAFNPGPQEAGEGNATPAPRSTAGTRDISIEESQGG